MKMKVYSYFVILFVASILIKTGANSINGNELFDQILASSRNDLNKTIVIPDEHNDEFSCWNVRVWGLENIRRAADASLEDNKNGTVTVSTLMEVSSVKGSGIGSYHYQTSFIITITKTWQGNFNIKFPSIEVIVVLCADLNQKKLYLADLKFQKFEDAYINIKLSGFWSLFSPIINSFAQNMLNDKSKPRVKDLIRKVVETHVKNFNKWDTIKVGL